MIEALKRLHSRVEAFLVRNVRDRLLVPAALALAYFVGVGLTSVVVRLLRPSVLRGPGAGGDGGWVKARGYDTDTESCLRQS